jgi:hypothetical protein
MSEQPPFGERRAHDPQIRDLQEKQGKILYLLTRIETILNMRADFDIRLRELEKEQAACRKHPMEEHEQRIKDLELDAAHLKGRAAIVGGLVGLGSSLVVSVAAALIIWQIKG